MHRSGNGRVQVLHARLMLAASHPVWQSINHQQDVMHAPTSRSPGLQGATRPGSPLCTARAFEGGGLLPHSLLSGRCCWVGAVQNHLGKLHLQLRLPTAAQGWVVCTVVSSGDCNRCQRSHKMHMQGRATGEVLPQYTVDTHPAQRAPEALQARLRVVWQLYDVPAAGRIGLQGCRLPRQPSVTQASPQGPLAQLAAQQRMHRLKATDLLLLAQDPC